MKNKATPKAAPPSLRDRIVEMRRVHADELVAHPENWRVHDAPQQKALQTLLAEIGFAGVVLTRKLPDGRLQIIDGHLRQKMAKHEKIPVVVTDLNEDEARKLLVTHDPLGAMAGTDPEALKALLEKLGASASEALKGVLDGVASTYKLANVRAGLTDPDAVPPIPTKAKTKLGDLYILGEHRLLCGDSTKPEDTKRALNGQFAALLATDPPYGVDYANVLGGRENQKAGGWRDIGGDNLDDEGLGKLITAALKQCDAPTLFLWHSWKRVEISLRAIRECGWKPVSEIVWVKNALVFGRSDYQWRHECCVYAKREGAPRQGDRTATTVWEFPKPHGGEHPTAKPVGLFQIPIQNHTQPGEIAYEPFAGSGSQVIAAEMLNRRCVAIEIDPIYCDVIVQRWCEFTGRKATKEAKP
jgi:DNA modification methylase